MGKIAYSSAVASLVAQATPRGLGPGRPMEEHRSALAALSEADLFDAGRVGDKAMARCCLAGLWLAFDFLDESHRISQDIATPSGSYWHGIMHRREPDYSNSKYWFRRVGRHAIFPTLRDEAAKLAEEWRKESQADLPAAANFLAVQDQWSPERFIDLCEELATGRVNGEHRSLDSLCRNVAFREWRLLLDSCRQRAAGDD